MNRDNPKRARSQPTIGGASYKGALVVGPSSIFAAWAHNLVRDAAAAMTPPLQVRFLDKFDDVGPEEEWSRTLYLTQFPSAPVISIIESGRMPVLAFLDEAQDAVAYIRRSSGCTLTEALRVATSGAVANRALLHGKSASVVHRNHRGSSSGLIDNILNHIVIVIPTEASMAIKQKYVGPPPGGLEGSFQRSPFYKAPGEWSEELTTAEAAIVDEVLKPMVLMASQENCPPIRWSYRVLLSGDRPNEPAPMIAEVAGAARNIYYGPYLHLPPGTYRARLVAGYSKAAIGLPFSVDVAGSTQLAKARFSPTEQGILQGEFLVVHNLPQDSLELRFRNDEGEIDGQVGFAWIEFEFLGNEDLPIHNVT